MNSSIIPAYYSKFSSLHEFLEMKTFKVKNKIDGTNDITGIMEINISGLQ